MTNLRFEDWQLGWAALIRAVVMLCVVVALLCVPTGNTWADAKEKWNVDIGRVGSESASMCFVSLPSANTGCANDIVFCRDGHNCKSMCTTLLSVKLAGRHLKRIRYDLNTTNQLCLLTGLMFE